MFFKKEILLSSLLVLSTPIIADSFKFESIKRDASGLTKKDKQANGFAEYKDIIATGYGVSEKKATDNAFRSAIQQYVGVIIDSETQLKNGQLIKDNILTASNGYIQEYKVLSVTNEEGLFEVEIKAVVKSQQLFKKIQALNINVITLNNTKDTQARIETKIKSNKDVNIILFKSMSEFISNSSLSDMLNLKINSVNIKEDKAENGKVPVEINYSISIDYDVYKNKIAKLESVFNNVGAKLINRVDLPEISNAGRQMDVKNKDKVRKFIINKENILFIIKKYGDGFKTDFWEFTNDVFNEFEGDNIGFLEKFNIILEIKGSDSVLFADNISSSYHDIDNIILGNIYDLRYENRKFSSKYNSIRGLMPVFLTNNSSLESLDVIYKSYFPVDKIGDIKSISLELEEK